MRKWQEGVETRYSNLSENMAKYPRAHDTRRMGDDIVRYSSESGELRIKSLNITICGDARGYDETVLPLRKQTFDAIANGIIGSLPFTKQAGAQQYASQGPTILQVNLNGREIAKEIYSDVSKFQENEKERLKVF
ncbi:hypothetical protein OCA23_18960 [Bacillus cereus]|nr:hypothetical protein [Bacillus cereus]